VPEGDHDLLPIDTDSSQAPEIALEPEVIDHTAEHILRFADLEGRVKVLKQQIRTAMDQAEKSAALSRKVSSLEDQISVLRSKIVRLEDGALYMTEIIEAASEQLLCKSL
jgi:predicted  nucleic acid-binding Zn-ribbon protein